jgi:hypothetical protein
MNNEVSIFKFLREKAGVLIVEARRCDEGRLAPVPFTSQKV